jgi:arabinan endo-1,5-alpha-L-arabinosidase
MIIVPRCGRRYGSRMRFGSLATLLISFALSACATPPRQSPAAEVVNPVLDLDFPDPAVLKLPDGTYYAYATQTEADGKWINIQVARSRDLKAWQWLGDALPGKPSWASRTQDFWAPHVVRDGRRYLLYYSAKPDAALTDDKRGLCLAVAVAERPEGPFTDVGAPLQCGASFINIDPMAFDDPKTGRRLLYWGSGFEPIRVRELAADRVSFAPASSETNLLSPVKSDDINEYQKLIEGAWVHLRQGYYYLFYSGDNCCGPKAHYAVLVARSRSATGPFETLAQATGAKSSVILERDDVWLAPGHNSIATDASGQDWIVYHAVDVRKPRSKPSDDVNTRRVMLIGRLEWDNGWPRVVR